MTLCLTHSRPTSIQFLYSVLLDFIGTKYLDIALDEYVYILGSKDTISNNIFIASLKNSVVNRNPIPAVSQWWRTQPKSFSSCKSISRQPLCRWWRVPLRLTEVFSAAKTSLWVLWKANQTTSCKRSWMVLLLGSQSCYPGKRGMTLSQEMRTLS